MGAITWMTVTPLVGAVVVMGLGLAGRRPAEVRAAGLGFAGLSLVEALGLWWRMEPAIGGMQRVERHEWIPTLGVEYYVGVDGLGLLMVLLAALVVLFSMAASWRVGSRDWIYVMLVLLLEAGLFGSFTALNFYHWFLFWELSLVPAYFLVKLWGGPGRVAAATQFFVYTMVGSVALLLGFLAVYLASGTMDMVELGRMGMAGELGTRISERFAGGTLTGPEAGLVIFGLVLLGFAVKVPLMPFHTWLPSTYAEAPTGVTMVLTGVMSKMGVYGLLRIVLPMFPEAMRQCQGVLVWLAVGTIVLSVWSAIAQRDLKRMMAYSSVNHLGYCLLGIFSVASVADSGGSWAVEKASALNGVILQMFNHGVSAAVLFWFVGLIEERTGGLRGLDDFGGLRKAAPVFCGLMGISVFASLGLPGLGGFIGEFLIFKGVFPLASWAAAVSVLGLLGTAIFLLTLMQRVFNGPLGDRWRGFPDLSVSERWVAGAGVSLMVWVGVYPQGLMGVINPMVTQWVAQMK